MLLRMQSAWCRIAFLRIFEPARMSEVSRQSVVRTYDRYAPYYDMLFGPIQRAGCRQMAAVVGTLAPTRVLEVGVGTGLTISRYPEAAALTGIDLCPRMLALAKQRASALPQREIHLALMDAESLDFADGSFDCVTVPYVLSVTPNPERLVAEIRRVCRPGGHIVIVNHFTGSRFWRPMERIVRSLADRIGFRSDFDYADNILRHDWTVLSSNYTSFVRLYRLVVIRNG